MKLIDADEIVYESIDSSDTEEYFAKYGIGILAVRKEDIDKIPSAEEESFEWCTDCKEYDQEAHCCHRWSKMIRKTVDEMQIVRCSECKWFQCNVRPDGYLPNGIDEFQCNHWDRSCDPTDFCSFAERREDG